MTLFQLKAQGLTLLALLRRALEAELPSQKGTAVLQVALRNGGKAFLWTYALITLSFAVVVLWFSWWVEFSDPPLEIQRPPLAWHMGFLRMAHTVATVAAVFVMVGGAVYAAYMFIVGLVAFWRGFWPILVTIAAGLSLAYTAYYVTMKFIRQLM